MNTKLTATEVAQLPAQALHALERRSGWEPTQLRTQADDLERGDHDLAHALAAADALDATVAALRTSADTIEVNGRLAVNELAARRHNARPFTGYVS